MNEDKGYRFNKDKDTVWLWKEVNLLQVFNETWDGNYIMVTRDGNVELDIAFDHEGIEDYPGKALLPHDVYIDKGLPSPFHEKVLKFVRSMAWNHVKVHRVKVIK